MYTEILTFGEYTYFVWSAFIFTFLTCFILFLKTKNDLAKQEKLYLLEYKKELSIAEVDYSDQREVFSSKPVY